MMIINYLYSLNHNVPPDEMAAQPLLRFLGHKICLGPKQRNKTREKVSAENRNDGSYLLFRHEPKRGSVCSDRFKSKHRTKVVFVFRILVVCFSTFFRTYNKLFNT